MTTPASALGPLASHIALLARHSLWATRRLLAAAALLPREALHRDIGLNFKSIQATVNHMVAADCVWFSRFRPDAHLALEAGKIAPLWNGEPDGGQWDEVGLGDTAAEELIRLAERWIALVGSMSEDELSSSFKYLHRSGATREQKVGEMLLHVFNHHTHHRGQISAGLAVLAKSLKERGELPVGFKAPSTDLVYFVEEEKAKLHALGSD